MATDADQKTQSPFGGQGVGLFEDPGHMRGDAILVRKWAGVVDPERVKPLLEKGYELADSAVDERGWARVMDVLHKYAKLEQDEAKAIEPGGNTTTNVQINGNVSLNDGRTELLSIIAAASQRAREAESSPTTDPAADRQPAIPAKPVD